MQLSAQEEYGLRCLLQVAKNDSKADVSPLRIPEIGAAEGLSPEYTAKLLRSLRQGGLVVSTRGAAGGYRLARPAQNITVWEVLQVLGGPLFSDDFCETHPGQLKDCIHSTDCSMRALWRFIGTGLKETLGSISLTDMFKGELHMSRWLDQDEKFVQLAAPKRGPKADLATAALGPIVGPTLGKE